MPTIPPNTTGINQTAIRYKLTLETELYMIHKNMAKDLKQQLLVVVEDIYVTALKKKYIIYGIQTCMKLINTQKVNYYKITPADLKIKTTKMNTLHNIN